MLEKRGLIAFILLAQVGTAAAGDAAVRLPRLTSPKALPDIDRVLRGQVRHIMAEGFPREISAATEQPIRSRAGAVYSIAACLKFAGCEAEENTRRFLLQLIGDLTRSHTTGGGKTASGRSWGDHWQSALWAYEIAFGAWLMWTELPDDLRTSVVRMVVHEADRFRDLSPPYSEFLDTKSEENSWNSLILIFAAEVLPDHPNAAKWRERGIEYTISSVATRSDRKSSRVVGGKPLRTWIRGANVHDDFTMENHGFVHPDYMTTISQNLTHALTYRLLGMAVPPALLFNAQPSYDILKVFTQRDCSLFYPNATDWSLHHLDHAWNVHILAERILRDREAAPLAACSLDTLRKMQARNPSGRLYAPGEYMTYGTIEQHSAFLVASGLIAAKLWAPVSDPAPLDSVWKRLVGVRVYDDGRLLISRTPESITSFAWGLRIMGMTFPLAPDPIVNPLDHSYIGVAGALPDPGDRPGRLGITTAALERAIGEDRFRISGVIVSEEEGGAAVTATARHGDLRKQFSFTALPTGASVYMERYDGQPAHVSGGLISLLEDERWVHGVAQRRIERGDGWLNVDNTLGFVVIGARAAPVERRDHRSRTLVLNPAPAMGSVTAIVTLPNATVEETRSAAGRLRRLEAGNSEFAAVQVGPFLVVSNFDGAGHTNALTGRVRVGNREIVVPVNGGATRILRVAGPCAGYGCEPRTTAAIPRAASR
jgi:hypothetical protein